MLAVLFVSISQFFFLFMSSFCRLSYFYSKVIWQSVVSRFSSLPVKKPTSMVRLVSIPNFHGKDSN